MLQTQKENAELKDGIKDESMRRSMNESKCNELTLNLDKSHDENRLIHEQMKRENCNL